MAACGDRSRGTAYAVPGERGSALTVEVLNGTFRTGLARLGTRVLRQRGLDVVYFGNAERAGGEIDSTRIVVRRGTAERGERIRRALGAGVIEVQLDSALLLDASVILGRDFAPRLEFHP